LAGLVRSKKVSASELVEAYIRRQLAVNDEMNAVVMNCYARARSEAKMLDAKAARASGMGPLHGVPMTIKDSLDTEGVISTGRNLWTPAIRAEERCDGGRPRAQGRRQSCSAKTNTPEFTLGGFGRHQCRQQFVVRFFA